MVKFKQEKDKMMKRIQLENGTELYEWLQSINIHNITVILKNKDLTKKQQLHKLIKIH